MKIMLVMKMVWTMTGRIESTMLTEMSKMETQARKAKVTMIRKRTRRSIVTKWMTIMSVTMVMTVNQVDRLISDSCFWMKFVKNRKTGKGWGRGKYT